MVESLNKTKDTLQRYYGCIKVHKKTEGYHYYVLMDREVDKKNNAFHIKRKKAERTRNINHVRIKILDTMAEEENYLREKKTGR